MLKTSESTESTIRPGKGIVRVDSNSKARRDRSNLKGSRIDDSKVGDSKVDNKVGKKG